MGKQIKFSLPEPSVVDKWNIKAEFTVYEVSCLHFNLNPDDAQLTIEPARVAGEPWADEFESLYSQLETDHKSGHISKLTKKNIYNWYRWKGLTCPIIFKPTGHKSPRQLKAAKRKPTAVTQKRMDALGDLLGAMGRTISVNNYPRQVDRMNLPFSKKIMYQWLKKRGKHFNITFSTFEQFWKDHATKICKLHRGANSDDLQQDAKFIQKKLKF